MKPYPSSSISRVVRILSYIAWGLVIAGALFFSIKVTKPDFIKLIVAAPKAQQILPQLMSPELFARESITSTVSIPFPIPCGSAIVEESEVADKSIIANPACASPGENFTVIGKGLAPESDVKIFWLMPDGRSMTAKRAMTDGDGGFETSVQARPIAASKDRKSSQLVVLTFSPQGKLQTTTTLRDVINAMFVTVFMALLATTFGTILAIPFAFLGARNVTYRGRIGKAIYYITRSFLNIIRSYEPLVMATVFALVVGFGNPFAGVLALVIVTTASLGKMFSEAVEGIDPGPPEAMAATGANRPQVILYGIVPQIVPDFLSYTIYHWDINVRISTIIGFVGGGGIGYFLSQSINTFEYHKAGTALLAIIIVVWALDFLSAEMRKRIA